MLLVFSDIWSSPSWRERTRVNGAPWMEPRTFIDGTPTMPEDQAREVEALLEAIQKPDDEDAAKGKQARNKKKQELIYYRKEHALGRAIWKGWVGSHFKRWKMNNFVDDWAKTIGWDAESMVKMSNSRTVRCIRLLSDWLLTA